MNENKLARFLECGFVIRYQHCKTCTYLNNHILQHKITLSNCYKIFLKAYFQFLSFFNISDWVPAPVLRPKSTNLTYSLFLPLCLGNVTFDFFLLRPPPLMLPEYSLSLSLTLLMSSSQWKTRGITCSDLVLEHRLLSGAASACSPPGR